jgi:hypothetical protein
MQQGAANRGKDTHKAKVVNLQSLREMTLNSAMFSKPQQSVANASFSAC